MYVRAPVGIELKIEELSACLHMDADGSIRVHMESALFVFIDLGGDLKPSGPEGWSSLWQPVAACGSLWWPSGRKTSPFQMTLRSDPALLQYSKIVVCSMADWKGLL